MSRLRLSAALASAVALGSGCTGPNGTVAPIGTAIVIGAGTSAITSVGTALDDFQDGIDALTNPPMPAGCRNGDLFGVKNDLCF